MKMSTTKGRIVGLLGAMMMIMMLLSSQGACAFSSSSLSVWHRTLPTRSSGSSCFVGSATGRLAMPKRSTRSGSTRTTSFLSMHMGHSHAHHHHSHDHNAACNTTPTPIDPVAQARKRRRRLAILCFCSLLSLGLPLMTHRKLSSTNGIVFAGSVILLSSLDKIRQSVLGMIAKLQQLRQGFLKHNPLAAVDDPHENSDATSVSKNNSNTPWWLFLWPSAVLSSSSTSNNSSTTNTVNHRKAADQVTWLGVVVNMLLSAGKLSVGLLCHSSALIADAGHSLSDLVSDFVTLWSVRIARLPPDDDHPYGHGKFEAIGSLFLALTLLATGLGIGAMAQKQLLAVVWSNNHNNAAVVGGMLAHAHHGHGHAHVLPPGPWALVMAALSIASKEWLYRITNAVGQSIKSSVVVANAWHHRSDAYSSVLALASIAVSIYIPSLFWADAAAGILVAGMISLTGVEILGQSIAQLSDSSHPELTGRIEQVLQDQIEQSNQEIQSVERIRARQVGSVAMVDAKVVTAPQLSPSASRTVEERLRVALMDQVHGLVDAEVHAQPPTANTVCPLLLSSQDIPPVFEVEQLVRQQALLVWHRQRGDDEKDATSTSSSLPPLKISNIVVNYEDTVDVVVDITLEQQQQQQTPVSLERLQSDATALHDALVLPENSMIHRANLYLNLMPVVTVPTPTVVSP